jgi:hypothetical protein
LLFKTNFKSFNQYCIQREGKEKSEHESDSSTGGSENGGEGEATGHLSDVSLS